jgi:hypothetical protein
MTKEKVTEFIDKVDFPVIFPRQLTVGFTVGANEEFDPVYRMEVREEESTLVITGICEYEYLYPLDNVNRLAIQNLAPTIEEEVQQ